MIELAIFLNRGALESCCAAVERLCIYLGAEVLLLLLAALFDPRKAYVVRSSLVERVYVYMMD